MIMNKRLNKEDKDKEKEKEVKDPLDNKDNNNNYKIVINYIIQELIKSLSTLQKILHFFSSNHY